MIRPTPRSPLFPYTTLFRSLDELDRPVGARRHRLGRRAREPVDDRAAGDQPQEVRGMEHRELVDRKSTRLNSSHSQISYAVFCLKKKNRIGYRVRDTIEDMC